MNKDDEVQPAAVSEQVVDTGAPTQVAEQPERQVPLAALEAERQKRQEREEENRYLRELAMQQKAQLESYNAKKPQDDTEEDLVNERRLKNFSEKELSAMKREISEQVFKDANPEALKMINQNLKDILDKKPWLADSIESAPNRYSRAYEIVQDYAPAMAARTAKADDARRIVENSRKPGSPVTVGKPMNGNAGDHMMSLRGKKEFREYRSKLLKG